jgi:hypothetical protein
MVPHALSESTSRKTSSRGRKTHLLRYEVPHSVPRRRDVTRPLAVVVDKDVDRRIESTRKLPVLALLLVESKLVKDHDVDQAGERDALVRFDDLGVDLTEVESGKSMSARRGREGKARPAAKPKKRD